MSVEIECRCGESLRIAAGRSVDCPSCGRCLAVSAGSGRALSVAIAVAAGFAVVAVGLLGALIGSRRTPEIRSNEPVAQVAVEPAPIPKPAVIPDLPIFDPPPVEPMPPAPEPVIPPKPEPVPVPPAPAVRPRAGTLESNVEPAGRYRVGDVIRQEVSFARKSAYQIAGVDLGQSAEYGFQSSIVIAKVRADGSLVAVQTIGSTKLIAADADMKANLTDALEKVQGTKFEIAVAPNGEITGLEGLKDPVRIARSKDAADPTQSLRLWSLLDSDAWKELAGLTFFQPGQPLKPKASWSKPAEHDWGPLGRWSGKTVFLASGKPAKSKLERIDFRHDLSHRPPTAEAQKDLPIHLAKADFRIVAAGGAILYDPATSRATAADELFRVRGSLIATLEGLNAVIAMEETQAFRLIVGEPKEQALVGRPPASPKK